MKRLWNIEIRHLEDLDGRVHSLGDDQPKKYTFSEAINVLSKWHPNMRKRARIVPA